MKVPLLPALLGAVGLVVLGVLLALALHHPPAPAADNPPMTLGHGTEQDPAQALLSQRTQTITAACGIDPAQVTHVQVDPADGTGIAVVEVTYTVVGGQATATMALAPDQPDLVTSCG